MRDQGVGKWQSLSEGEEGGIVIQLTLRKMAYRKWEVRKAPPPHSPSFHTVVWKNITSHHVGGYRASR